MKPRFIFPVALVLVATLPVLAQRGQEHGQERGQSFPRANQGRIPPPPERRDDHRAKPEPERHETGHMNTLPHVNKNHWYGHDRPDDRRYHFDHPFEHGRFEHFGPSYRYRMERFDPDHHRFWLPGGFYFEVASWDWPICADCAGTAPTISSFMRIPTTSGGTCSTTFTPAYTSTSITWVRSLCRLGLLTNANTAVPKLDHCTDGRSRSGA